MTTPRRAWKPHVVLALTLALLGGAVAVLAELGLDRRLASALGKGAATAAVCGVVGFCAGLVLRVLCREMDEPDAPDYFRIPEELGVIKAAFDEKITNEEQGPELEIDGAVHGDVGVDSKLEREEVMVTDAS